MGYYLFALFFIFHVHYELYVNVEKKMDKIRALVLYSKCMFFRRDIAKYRGEKLPKCLTVNLTGTEVLANETTYSKVCRKPLKTYMYIANRMKVDRNFSVISKWIQLAKNQIEASWSFTGLVTSLGTISVFAFRVTFSGWIQKRRI